MPSKRVELYHKAKQLGLGSKYWKRSTVASLESYIKRRERLYADAESVGLVRTGQETDEYLEKFFIINSAITMEEHKGLHTLRVIMNKDDDDARIREFIRVAIKNLQADKQYKLVINYHKPDGDKIITIPVTKTKIVKQLYTNKSKQSISEIAEFCPKLMQTYGELELIFTEVPAPIQAHDLVAKQGVNNCVLQIVANTWSARKKLPVNKDISMLENIATLTNASDEKRNKILSYDINESRLKDFQQLANITNDRYTFHDLFGNVIHVVKGHSSSNRNINMYVNDGHAYPCPLERPKNITQFILSNNINKSLAAEPNTVTIYPIEDASGIRCYSTSDGRMVKCAANHNSLVKYASEVGYAGDMQKLQSTNGIDFKRFIQINQYEITSYFKSEIKESMLEANDYNRVISSSEKLINYDINSAYCSVPYKTNPAYEYFNTFQIPQQCHLNMRNPTVEFATSVSGFVKVQNIKFISSVHPWISRMVLHKEFIPTSVVKFLVVDAKIATMDLLWVCWSPHTRGLQFIGTNAQNRNMVGKCQQHSSFQVLIRDDVYRAFLINKYKDTELISYNQDILSFKSSEYGYYEVRSSILAFHYIAMCKVIMQHDINDVAKVGTDNLFVTESKFRGIMSSDPGCFKLDKNQIFLYRTAFDPDREEVQPRVATSLPDNCYNTVAATDADLEVLKHKVSLITGAGGSGKSTLYYKLAKQFKGHMILTPTKVLASRKRKEIKGLNICNWHRYFGCADVATFKKLIARGCHRKLVIIDEVYMMSEQALRVFIPFLLEFGATVICIGDPYQIKPFTGTSPNGYLQSIATYKRHFNKDYRSKGKHRKHTMKMKQKLRGMPEEQAIEYIKKKGGRDTEVSFDNFLARWSPSDKVYASTNSMGNYITTRLQQIHKDKYPTHPVPLIYTNEHKQLSGESLTMKLGQKLPKSTAYNYTSTVHKSIGDTVTEKIWIIEDRNSSLFCENGIYTAFSRCKDYKQVSIVTLPKEVEMLGHWVTNVTDDMIKKRIQVHIQQDKKKNREITDDYIDVAHVRELIYRHPMCGHCGCVIRSEEYYDRAPQRWSINRLDNLLCHSKGNTEVCCFACNVHHNTRDYFAEVEAVENIYDCDFDDSWDDDDCDFTN